LKVIKQNHSQKGLLEALDFGLCDEAEKAINEGKK